MAHIFFEKLENRRNTQSLAGNWFSTNDFFSNFQNSQNFNTTALSNFAPIRPVNTWGGWSSQSTSSWQIPLIQHTEFGTGLENRFLPWNTFQNNQFSTRPLMPIMNENYHFSTPGWSNTWTPPIMKYGISPTCINPDPIPFVLKYGISPTCVNPEPEVPIIVMKYGIIPTCVDPEPIPVVMKYGIIPTTINPEPMPPVMRYAIYPSSTLYIDPFLTDESIIK